MSCKLPRTWNAFLDPPYNSQSLNSELNRHLRICPKYLGCSSHCGLLGWSRQAAPDGEVETECSRGDSPRQALLHTLTQKWHPSLIPDMSHMGALSMRETRRGSKEHVSATVSQQTELTYVSINTVLAERFRQVFRADSVPLESRTCSATLCWAAQCTTHG